MKDFILYPEALALKELGFDEPCLGRWLVITKWEKPTGEVRLQIGFNAETWDKNQCFAPTYSQAFRFFREKYDLQHNIVWNKFYDKTPYQYEVRPTWRNEPLRPYGTSGMCSTYEEAELACLRNLIEIVKNKSI